MKDIVKGILGVVLGLSLIANAALIFSAFNDVSTLRDYYEGLIANLSDVEEELNNREASIAARERALENEGGTVPKMNSGLALFTSANAPSYMNENLFNSVHSAVYDNESVFYIPYSASIAASEAGYNEKRADYEKLLLDLWDQNRNRFVKKNKEFSTSLETYDTDAYCTFFILDDDNHDSVLAIISDGVVYYDFARDGNAEPFSLYNTRWNKYIRRDLSELLDNPNQAYLSQYRTAKGLTEDNTDLVLYDNGDIRIIEKGTGTDNLGWKLNLLIENNSNTDIRIECKNETVNRYMMSSLFYADVLAGTNKVDAIYFKHDQLSASEITNVQEIGFSFVISEKDSGRVLATSDMIRLSF